MTLPMTLPIAVIGAGPSGLPACKALAEAGLDYECLEARDQVGGVWNLDGPTSGAYRSLQTNTSTHTMAYSDFPFAEGAPLFPRARELQEYFEAYASEFGLHAKIRFGHRALRATPREGGGWRIEFAQGETREYSALLIATGQYVKPHVIDPPIPGDFHGEQLHTFDYLDPVTPVDCRGKRVVVIGLGSSAAEIATELSDPKTEFGAAEHVMLSARSGRWVVPKVLGGKPIDVRAPHPSEQVPRLLRALPPKWGVYLMRRLFRMAVRRGLAQLDSFESLGLPVPTIEPWEERPTISHDFIPALKERRIDVRPGIRSVDGTRVDFSDGSSADADVIIHATGYELDFPFLARDVLGCEAKQLRLYQRVAHPGYDDLFFLGCLRVNCSLWPVAEQQSRWIAKLLKGEFEMPSRSRRERAAVSLTQSLPVMCNFYVDALRREAGGL
jgi:dimethylaniline monooxygenase (N-oxide forming)